jgi:hypothetical protein
LVRKTWLAIAFILDVTNRIVSATAFEFETDRGAIAHALSLDDGRNQELWSGARVVAHMNHLEDADRLSRSA